MIRSRLIYIVEEVIYAAQLCRPPASGIAEEDGPRDRLVCKVVVVLLYLSDDVLLKDRVNSILSPAVSFRPEDYRVDLVLAVPAVSMAFVEHLPLAGAWQVRLVAELALEDQLTLALCIADGPLAILHLELFQLPQLHPLADHGLIVRPEAPSLGADTGCVRI